MSPIMTWLRLALRARGAVNRPAPRSRRLELEPLEVRLVPVVGAFSLAPEALPGWQVDGVGFDGVVEIVGPNGTGTGALLFSGRHILTAAHVVDTDGDGVVDPGNYKVMFQRVGGEFFTYDVSSSNIVLPPGAKGNYARGYQADYDNDIAVMTLPGPAPLSADRYQINSLGNELGQTFVIVGYGLPGVGSDGEVEDPAVVRHFGFNVYDALGENTGGLSHKLAFDFDNGLQANNALLKMYGIDSVHLGEDEAFHAHGDSGGPQFIGNRIAGITSAYGYSTVEVKPSAAGSFGSIGYATRVSDFAEWIRQQVYAAPPYDLILNMAQQPGGGDGWADAIDARVVGDSLELFVHNTLIHIDLLANIKSLQIFGTTDHEEIAVAGALTMPVYVNSGGGFDTLIVDDSANTMRSAVNIAAGTVSITTNLGAGGVRQSKVNFSPYDFGSLIVKAGTPTFNGLPGIYPGNTIDVADTLVGQAGGLPAAFTLYTGYGSDRVTIAKLSCGTSVIGQGGQDTVTVGKNNSLAGIQYTLGVTNEFGSTQLNLLGGADNQARYVTMDYWPLYGNFILGLAQAAILFDYTGIRGVNVTTGDGADFFDIRTIRVPMTIHAGNGNDFAQVQGTEQTLNIDLGPDSNFASLGGLQYGLNPIIGAVNVQAAGGTASVYIDDRGELYSQHYTLSANAFQAESTGRISFADVHDLVVYGGQGQGNALFGTIGNTFDILDTLPLSEFGSQTLLFAGPSRDAVNVRGTTGALYVEFQEEELESLQVGSAEAGLDPIRGSVFLLGGGPGLSINVDDSGAAVGHTFTINQDQLLRSGASVIGFGDAQGFSMWVQGGAGGNVYDIQGKRGNLGVNAGAGDDVVNIGAEGGLLSNLGFFVVNGQAGTDTVNLLDQGETVDQPYAFFEIVDVPGYEGVSVFTAPGTTVLLGDGQTERLALLAGSGSDAFDGALAPANITLLVSAGAGDDVVQGGAGRNVLIGGQGMDQLGGGSEEDVLIAGGTVYDGAPAALAAVMAEWGRTDLPFAERVEHLLNGGGLNGDTLLNAAYLADEGGNVLTGASNLNLYFGSLAQDAHDWDPNLGAIFVEPASIQTQTVAFDALADGTYGDAPIALNATASSGLAVGYRILSGPATIQDNVLTITGAGVVVVEAFQDGDGAFAAADSVQQSFTVNKAHLTVTADNQVRVFGQANALFAATFAGFVNGETLADSGVSGDAAFSSNDAAASPVGTYSIAVSQGTLDAANYDFAFVNGSLKVNKAGTTVALKSSALAASVGQQITFTATVAAAGPGSGIPGGTVTFKDGATVLGTGTLSNGVATFKTATLAVGNHSITAVYGGSSNFTSKTSAVVTQTVAQASKTTLATSLATSTFGQAVTLNATVAPATGAGTPTGTVTFMDGATTLGTATLSGGKATLTTALLRVGNHAITAVYAGNATFGTSTSAALTQTVKQAATTVALNSSAATAVFGQTVTLTAKIAVVAPGAGVPSGTVTFKDGATVLGTATLSNGVATFQTAKLAVGNHSLTAVFSGDSNFTASTSAALAETIKKAATTTTLTSSAGTAASGTTITLTAKIGVVAPGAALPTGTVTFMDGTTVLGTGTVNNGVVTLKTAKLSKGKHTLTAVYGGDANLTVSTSVALVVTIV